MFEGLKMVFVVSEHQTDFLNDIFFVMLTLDKKSTVFVKIYLKPFNFIV